MPSWKKIIVSGSAGSLSALTVSTNITASGHVSASSTSTGSFGAVNVAGMSVSNLVDVSSSFSTRVSNLKTDSGSFSTRVTRNEATGSSLTTASSSFSTRVTRNEATGSSLSTASSSFSTRVSNLKTDSGSFSTRITAVTSSISALKTDSGSYSTRVSNLKTDSGSYSTRVSNLKSDSGSFSTRVTTNEGDLTTLKGSGTAQGVGQSNSPTFVNITATGTMTAKEFHTEFVSSSIVYRSGSTKFGDTIDDVHSFSGSINLSGSFNHNDGNMTISDTLTAATVDINGGAIDGTTIGAASATTIKGTTIDATTDFTIDGLVLTADTITNDQTLTMDIADDMVIDVDGGNLDVKDSGAVLLNISATDISGSATSTGSFGKLEGDGSGISGVTADEAAPFLKTGSMYAANTDIQITGSLSVPLTALNMYPPVFLPNIFIKSKTFISFILEIVSIPFSSNFSCVFFPIPGMSLISIVFINSDRFSGVTIVRPSGFL